MAVKRCLHSLLCVLAALHLMGGHWGVMQIIAWGHMLRTYSEERGLVTALLETFDGEHACCMCKKIAQIKDQETKKEAPLPERGHENLVKWFGMWPSFVLMSDESLGEGLALACFATPLMTPGQWCTQPLVPPPECAS